MVQILITFLTNKKREGKKKSTKFPDLDLIRDSATNRRTTCPHGPAHRTYSSGPGNFQFPEPGQTP